MASRWLEALKEEENKHNTAAALRGGQNRHGIGPAGKSKTPVIPPSKTSNTLRENPPAPIKRASKTSETTEAERLGLIATWSAEFGFVSLHDPTTGEWYDLQVKDAPGWAVGEARRRKELYKEGNRKALRLTSREMEQIWKAERPADEVGIVEEHPLEDA